MSGNSGKVRVAVVFGGRSAEHAISCVSAGSVIGALDPERYDVVPVGIATDGRWVLADPDQRLAITDGRLPEVTGGTAVSLVGDPAGRELAVLDPGRAIGPALTQVDVVFPVLHGPYGEDGTIQGLLEMAGVPYVGSGVFASAVSMDKEFTKKLLAAGGLPQGDHAVLRDADGGVCPDPAGLDDATRRRLGLPVFVKPSRAGSSRAPGPPVLGNPPPPGPHHGHPKGAGRARPPRRGRDGRGGRPQGDRRGGGARARDRVRRARRPGRGAPRGEPARRDQAAP